MLEQVDAVRSVLSEDRNLAHLVITWQDRDILESVATTLKPLKCMTEHCVTVSAVKPLLNHLLKRVLVAEDDDTDLTKEMKERIKVDLEVRYLDSAFDHLLELSSFLDPGFKLNYVNNRAKVLEEIENEMSRMIECLVDDTTTTSLPSASNTSQCGDSGDTVIMVPPAKKSKGLSKVLGYCLSNSQCNVLTTRLRVKQELDQYLSHPHLDIEESPLNWWKIEAV